MPGRKPGIPSIVSASLRVTGNLVSDGDIQIDGTVEGDIRTPAVTVGRDAEVKGEIVAETVTIHGRVVGAVRARTVFLAKTARVQGDIHQETLTIESGASFEGQSRKLALPPAEDIDVPLIGEAPRQIAAR